MSEPAPPPSAGDLDRRGLLAVATSLLGAGLCLGPLGVAAAPFLGPLREKAATDPGAFVDLGPLAGFEAGRAKKVPVRGRPTDAFFLPPERLLGAAVVVRDGEEGARVFSSQCPHAGCDVEPEPDGKAIGCPCHDSRFGLDGAVASGPAPRGLDALEVKVERGRVLARFARFRPGTSEKRPV